MSGEAAVDAVAAGALAVGDTTLLAPDVAAFVCVTDPLSPGLATRTETLTFDGAACPVPVVAESLAGAAEGVVEAVVEPLPASFDCVTAPSVPGLSTRTETLTLAGVACATAEVTVAAIAFGSGVDGIATGGSVTGGRSSARAA